MVKKLSDDQKQEMEKSITLKFGRLAVKSVNKSLEQKVRSQVSRQWRSMNGLSSVGYRRDNMSSNAHAPHAQTYDRLEIPPLDSFVRMNQNQDQLQYNQILPEKDQNRGLSEFLQNNCPLGPPQIFHNTNNPAYANGPVPHCVFGNVPNLLNPAMTINNGQNFYQERYANGPMPNNVFQNVPNLLNPAVTLNNRQNFHEERYAHGPMLNNVFQNVPNILNPAMTLNNGQNFHQEQDTITQLIVNSGVSAFLKKKNPS